ncbi:MAG: Gfo/Idh/MocA family oxidoreductase [Actinomycetota bacterium]|nr:Gfo/Idh/MocA family oxidoreductase [Actinomycetota bacterium]
MVVRVGFYGAGLISAMHTRLLVTAGLPYEIVAVHDPDRSRAERFAHDHGARVAGPEELVELVDAVYVTAWTSEHARLVAAAAARGRAVFCEKPLAFDAPAAEAIVASAAGVVNQVGLILRALPTFRWVRHLLADDRAGPVMGVVFRDDQYLPTQGMYGSTWRADPARAGRGALLEHSIHDADILQWLLGPAVSVSGRTREVHGLDRIDDVAAATITFRSGAIAQLLSVWHDVLERPSNRRVEVLCARLHVTIHDEFAGPVTWRFTGEPEETRTAEELVDLVRSVERDDPGPTTGVPARPIFNPATSFLRAVRDGGTAEPPLAAAVAAHHLVDAIDASAEAGGRPTDVAAPRP